MENLNNLKSRAFENIYIQDLGVDISGILPGTYKKDGIDPIQWALETDKKYRKIRKKQITKQEWEVRLNLGADYLYYDLFSRIWGWGKYKRVFWSFTMGFGAMGSALACFLLRHRTRSGGAGAALLLALVQFFLFKKLVIG